MADNNGSNGDSHRRSNLAEMETVVTRLPWNEASLYVLQELKRLTDMSNQTFQSIRAVRTSLEKHLDDDTKNLIFIHKAIERLTTQNKLFFTALGGVLGAIVTVATGLAIRFINI